MAARKGRNGQSIGFARWAICGACLLVAAAAVAVLPLVAQESDRGAAGRSVEPLKRAARASYAPGRIARAGEAERLIRKELGQSPVKSAAWTRLAYAQWLADGAFTPRVAASLQRSYATAPYDSDLLLWRTQFTFSHWREAPKPLREAAFAEVNGFGRFNVQRKALEGAVRRVSDPSGQFALMIALEGSPGS